jgi:hypothetical protein
VGSTAYIKPLVAAEITDSRKLADEFAEIKPRTKLANYYDAFDTLIPSQCFKLCKESKVCGAASFTTDPECLFNCFLFRPAEFVKQTNLKAFEFDFWTSYMKVVSDQPVK